MIEFIENYPISDLSPADYNPRLIDEVSFQMLRESLDKFGVIKPVLLNGNGTLMAGHQRVKALIANGQTHVPALRTKHVGLKDEARLNLYHNSVETNASEVAITGELAASQYQWIEPKRINIIKREKPAIVAEICRLIVKYHEWGSLIVSPGGKVLFNSEYAVSSATVRKPVLAYVLPDNLADEMFPFLKRDYGRYHYDTLPVENINQKKCQMHRLRDGAKGKKNHSSCYELVALPRITKEQRGFDFGEGYGDYRKRLQSEGYSIDGYEPFQCVIGTSKIDLPTIRTAIKRAEENIGKHGLFDYVVLDSVINSVTSLEFEHYVLTVCNALCRNDGTFYTATRRIQDHVGSSKKKFTRKQRAIEFMDDDGFSTIFRDGLWTKQRFHSDDSFRETLLQYFDEVEIFPFHERAKLQICALARRPKALSEEVYRTAIATEFNLDYNGVKLNAHAKLLENIMLKLKSNDRIA
jgi:ParB family chromosome partitioning protein